MQLFGRKDGSGDFSSGCRRRMFRNEPIGAEPSKETGYEEGHCMERNFMFPLTMKDGKVFDALGKDITEEYLRYKQADAAEKLVRALEELRRIKDSGVETRHMLFLDTAYRYCAVVETFVGDDLSERLNLAYAEKVLCDEEGNWFLDKMNRTLYPIQSLAQLYSLAARGLFSIKTAETIWDNRGASFFLIRDLFAK
jgi:hypothetical protein